MNLTVYLDRTDTFLKMVLFCALRTPPFYPLVDNAFPQLQNKLAMSIDVTVTVHSNSESFRAPQYKGSLLAYTFLKTLFPVHA